jgi:hypothetical protein
MTVKSVSSILHFVCTTTDDKSEIIAPPGSRLYEFTGTTVTPVLVTEWITTGAGVWAKTLGSQESST